MSVEINLDDIDITDFEMFTSRMVGKCEICGLHTEKNNIDHTKCLEVRDYKDPKFMKLVKEITYKWSFVRADICPVCGQKRGSVGRMIQHMNKSKLCRKYILMKRAELIRQYVRNNYGEFIDLKLIADEDYVHKNKIEERYIHKDYIDKHYVHKNKIEEYKNSRIFSLNEKLREFEEQYIHKDYIDKYYVHKNKIEEQYIHKNSIRNIINKLTKELYRACITIE